MHILESPSFFPPYGGLFCLDQAKALAALGHEVRILSNVQLGASVGLKDYLTLPYGRYEHLMDGIMVYQSYQRGVPKMILHNVSRWVTIVQSMFADYEKRYGLPDIIHAHCAKWAGYAAMLISREYGIPYVITEHLSYKMFEEEFGLAPSTAWQIGLLKEAYREAACVVHVSEEQVDNIAPYFGRDYRWQYISNTIDVDFYHHQSRLPLTGRPFRFCCLANYWPLKGYDVLFEALRHLQSGGLGAELHVAGLFTDGKKCKQAIDQVQLRNVHTYGRVDKQRVRSLLYECDALVLPSRSEVQPLVLLEAMSTGIPVVATECTPRCLRIEGGCTIVPVDDARALAEAMKGLMLTDHPDGQCLSEKVRAMASPAVIGRRLSELFTQIKSQTPKKVI